MKTKKKYEKPRMEVYELRQPAQLLQTSSTLPAPSNYESDTEGGFTF